MNTTDTIRAARVQGAHNPWGVSLADAPAQELLHGIDMSTKPAPKTTFAPSKHLDPDSLVICDDEIPAHRKKVANKYAPIFEKMKMGQALKVPADHVGKVSNSMRKWIQDTGKDAHIRSISLFPDCPHGLGRVWLMAGPQSAPPVSKGGKGRA